MFHNHFPSETQLTFLEWMANKFRKLAGYVKFLERGLRGRRNGEH